MKTPQTINEILEFFEGLTFHGIDLSLVLCHHFHSSYVLKSLSTNHWYDWLYRFLRLKPIFFFRVWTRSFIKKVEIPNADYLLLSAGVPRTTSFSFPILEKLAPSSRLIVFIEPRISIGTEYIPYLRLQDIPFSYKEWRKAISSLWNEINIRLTNFAIYFKPNNLQIHSVFSSLCWSVATILRAEYLLEKAEPNLVFAEEDRKDSEAIIVQVCKRMGIPSSALVHGLRGGDSFLTSLQVPLIADHLIVWGEWMKKDFIQLGVPEDKILIGGYPRLFPLTLEDKIKSSELLKLRGIPEFTHVVVMLSNSLGNYKPGIEFFMSAQKYAPNYYFMIRPHPVEEISWYETYMPHEMARVQDYQQWTLSQSIASADVIVGTSSTSCLDAILTGKPVILLNDPFMSYRDIPILKEAVDRGVVFVAESPEQLAFLVQKEIVENGRVAQTFANECVACLGTEAAQLTGEVLKKLASDSEE